MKRFCSVGQNRFVVYITKFSQFVPKFRVVIPDDLPDCGLYVGLIHQPTITPGANLFMNRKSTSRMAVWLIIFLGAAFWVNTIRRNLNSTTGQNFSKIAHTLSNDALIVSTVVRTLLFP
jgi:hypothetical protein